MIVSLLISTYNWPEALDLVLKSVANQSVMPDEILIADDGSTDETTKVIDDFNKNNTVKAIRFWHEDKGFRKTIILNKAIAKAKGDYIIQTDGDCILHPKFVEDHMRFSKENTYLYGSRVTLSKDFVKQLFSSKKVIFSLFSKGISKRTRAVRIPLFSSFYKPKIEVSKKVRGCNISFWKKDIIAVNGYNEDLTGWGREDSELVYRLSNLGIKGRRIRYSGIVYHIWHPEFSKNNLNKNDSIQQKSIANKTITVKNGIDKYFCVFF